MSSTVQRMKSRAKELHRVVNDRSKHPMTRYKAQHELNNIGRTVKAWSH